MTRRGWVLLLASAVTVVIGWTQLWPELTALGSAGVVAVLITAVISGGRVRARLEVDQSALRIMRGQEAGVRLELTVDRGGRGLRLVEGNVAEPSGSVPIPRSAAGSVPLRFPIDTSRRGQRPIGPFTLVQGDPWGIVRRRVATAVGGIVTIQPRVYPVRPGLISRRIVFDSENADRRLGDTHFHALRDYVLGDEARMVHWRSSARAGHLVVRQNLAPTSSGTTIILDTDSSAYGSDHQFGTGWVPERFESAVEVVASIIASLPQRSGQVHLATTTIGSNTTSAAPGATVALLDRLAVVEATPPLDVVPAQLVTLVRATHCSRLIVVTGTPGRALPPAVTAAARSVASTTVIRVGAAQQGALEGLRVVDITSAEELL